MIKNQNQSNDFDVIVVGAGHAGLSISYFLKKNNIEHIVLEKGRIGESWRSQRWDSFKLNTPNWISTLSGESNEGDKRENFQSLKEFTAYLSNYAVENNLPVKENSNVLSLEKGNNGEFIISVSDNGTTKNYTCNKVVVASGLMNEIKIPGFAKNISSEVLQLHTSRYKNPSQLPEGAVLVVGSGQSGCQIAEDILDAGKRVYFSTSRVPRMPRGYRGKDVMEWLIKSGFFDARTDEITDPEMLNMKQPQISGVGELGHTLSLQYLSSRGVKILGKLKDAENIRVYFENDAAENVKFADGSSKKFKEMIDGFIKQAGIEAPAPEPDPADEPDIDAKCAEKALMLDLKGEDIKTIVWTTGFAADFSWIKLPVFKDGKLLHKDGVSEIAGLYFLGFPWLRKRKSGIIYGISEDAEYIFNELRITN